MEEWNSKTLNTSCFALLFARPPHGIHLLWFCSFDSCLVQKRNKKMKKCTCFSSKWNHFSNFWRSIFCFHLRHIFWRWLSSIWCLYQACSKSVSWLAVKIPWLWFLIRPHKAPSSFYIQCNIHTQSNEKSMVYSKLKKIMLLHYLKNTQSFYKFGIR